MNNPWLNTGRPAAPRRESPRRDPTGAGAGEGGGSRPDRNEVRWYGVNAIKAVFAHRPDALRKIYVADYRLKDLGDILKWCADHRVGYRVVDNADLERLAKSQHHEGVVADVLKQEPVELDDWLDSLPADGPCVAIWLDGVGNPHNLGAILRSAAHFDATAVLLPPQANAVVSGAAARVAEGGAEHVKVVRLRERTLDSLTVLRRNQFKTFATVVEGGENLFTSDLPQRLVWILGAEGEGMDRSLAELADAQVSIPGTGKVESLNVANAAAVLLARSAIA